MNLKLLYRIIGLERSSFHRFVMVLVLVQSKTLLLEISFLVMLIDLGILILFMFLWNDVIHGIAQQ